MANLSGAVLQEAQLEGASLANAQLEGANLDYAELQGASLVSANLEGTSLAVVFVWRADARRAVWKDTWVTEIETGPKEFCLEGRCPQREMGDEGGAVSTMFSEPGPWSVDSFKRLKQMIPEVLPERNSDAMERIEKLDQAEALEGEAEMAEAWEAQARSSLDIKAYDKRLAGIWQEIGCDLDGAPYVLRRLLDRLKGGLYPYGFGKLESQKVRLELAKAFVDEKHCPGARWLTEAEKAELEAMPKIHPLK